MDDSPIGREPSPDWLRTFQTPTQDFKTLSSSSPSTSLHDATPKESLKFHMSDDLKEEANSVWSIEAISRIGSRHVVNLDSDGDKSEEGKKVFSTRVKSPKGDSPLSKGKSGSRKSQPQSIRNLKETMETEDQDVQTKPGAFIGALSKSEGDIQEEDAAEGHDRRMKRVLSTLPLVFGDKVQRSKVLLECEGDALDLSGDVGAVGRLSVLENHEDDFLLDLKGMVYKGTIVPSNTFFVVNIGALEAKVEAIMNDFVQLQPNANIFESETMVEGTLEGFGFDSDDDKDRVPVPAGMISKDDVEDEKKKSQPKKLAKGLTKNINKAGTSKNVGKGGGSKKAKGTGKSAKKPASTKKMKLQKKTGK